MADGMQSYNGGGDSGNRADEDNRKLFVGGLSWETTQEELQEYFSKYGTVVKCILKTDPNTGRSRGFGFVVFEDKDVIEGVMSSTHTLNGRQIDPKRAKSRPGQEPIKKIFVGGLDPDATDDDIRSSFSEYGMVENIERPFDKINNKARPFAFVTFETEEIVNDIVKHGKMMVAGKECDVKKATPREDRQGGRGGARGGRGGARGGGRGGSYSQGGWGGYGNYDQSGYGQGYGSYDYGQYGGYGSYGGQGYDYSGWGQGYGQGGQGYDYSGYGQQGGYKGGSSSVAKRGGGSSSYKPY
ncbi:PREDICTED: RNA-binding protein squid-like isoform X2 [Priapulus caudatus]|uniref:RNA-binding protein squid-like isoform X2 n=1 Tax=Priapulus caudatus TaxID=37621 RepID=A0ABM1F585_PRICU|nr:PREDICTED: RNA-binding protein squid-like isoform X2 [Priapulus caudatus]